MIDELSLPRAYPNDTILEGQEFIRRWATDGGNCPCCGQRFQLYRRKLNSGMAATLVWLVMFYDTVRDWVDVPEVGPKFVNRSREIGKLLHWGMVELHPGTGGKASRTSGLWKPTDEGALFAAEETKVSKYVYLYNNQVEGFSDETISIREALVDRFDYDELVGTNWYEEWRDRP